MVVHQLFESRRAARAAQQLRDEGAAAAPRVTPWTDQPRWVWLIWLIMRLACLVAFAVSGSACLVALLFWVMTPRRSASRRLVTDLFHTCIHSVVGILLPALGLGLLISAPGWARSAFRATALSAYFRDQ